MVAEIRRFNADGNTRFIELLGEIRKEPNTLFPKEIITDESLTEIISGVSFDIDSIDLSDKWEAAQALDLLAQEVNQEWFENDQGLWNWLSAALFEKGLCDKNEDNSFRLREEATLVLQTENWKRYYRHYLASIWQVYNSHRDNPNRIKVLLHNAVNVPGELWAQVVGRQNRFTRVGIMGMVTKLYWDEKSETRKPGAGGKSPRRLMDVLSQLSINYDLCGMESETITELLPSEFDRFLET